MAIRFHVDPRDVPAHAAARRLGLTEAKFNDALPQLLHRGFPAADATTGNYDLDAIDAWRARRHGGQNDNAPAKSATVARARLEARRNG